VVLANTKTKEKENFAKRVTWVNTTITVLDQKNAKTVAKANFYIYRAKIPKTIASVVPKASSAIKME
jgi:hypothetical protein